MRRVRLAAGQAANRLRTSATHAVALLVVCAIVARAQQVQIRVREEATGSPVAGALLSVISSAESVVAEGLTDSTGARYVQVPTTGLYRVRVRRIGYTPYLSEPALVVTDAQIITLRITLVRVRLDTVTVVSTHKECRAADPQSFRSSALWTSISSALTASRVTRDDALADAGFTTFERRLDSRFKVLDEKHSVRGVSGAPPFDARSPDELSRRGYSFRDNDKVVFFAPDERVLLSDEFLNDHCFTAVARGGASSDLIGLRFDPVVSRTAVEIAGTIWVDTTTAELRSIEFKYTNLPLRIEDDSLGGRVDFARLPNGAWIVSRWVIRVPKLQVSVLANTIVYAVTGYAETGGSVSLGARLGLGDGPATYRQRVMGLFDGTTGDVIADAQVIDTVSGIGRTSTKAGIVSLDFLIEGVSTVLVRKPGFDDQLIKVSISPRDTTPITAVLMRRGAIASANGPSIEASVIRLPGLPRGLARTLGVFDSLTGKPVGSVDVIDIVSGRSSTTNETGMAALDFLPSSGSLVSVRKIGYAPQTVLVAQASATPDTVPVLLQRLTELSAVVSRDSTRKFVGPMLRSFEDRMAWGQKTGFGRFLTEDVLRKSDGRRLMNVPAQYIDPQFGVATPVCSPDLFVDGVRRGKLSVSRSGRSLADEIDVSEIAGIEYYGHGLEIPPQFHLPGVACVLLLWTRER